MTSRKFGLEILRGFQELSQEILDIKSSKSKTNWPLQTMFLFYFFRLSETKSKKTSEIDKRLSTMREEEETNSDDANHRQLNHQKRTQV